LLGCRWFSPLQMCETRVAAPFYAPCTAYKLTVEWAQHTDDRQVPPPQTERFGGLRVIFPFHSLWLKSPTLCTAGLASCSSTRTCRDRLVPHCGYAYFRSFPAYSRWAGRGSRKVCYHPQSWRRTCGRRGQRCTSWWTWWPRAGFRGEHDSLPFDLSTTPEATRLLLLRESKCAFEDVVAHNVCLW
jgi:hypothetical protein